jgi:hypothetical protein
MLSTRLRMLLLVALGAAGCGASRSAPPTDTPDASDPGTDTPGAGTMGTGAPGAGTPGTGTGTPGTGTPGTGTTVADAGTTVGTGAAVDAGSPNAVPCSAIHSGYAGDDMCIKPPDPAAGFQLHYGPADYANTTEVKNYLLAPGQEVTACVYLPMPNPQSILVDEYHSRMRPGSHHFILFTQTQKVAETGPNDAPDSACNPLTGMLGNYVIGAQQSSWDLVGNVDGAPENNGMAQSMPGNLQAILQYHFINVTAQPILREGWLNVIYADAAKVTQLKSPIYFVGGGGMDVAEGTSTTIHASATVPANVGQGFRVLSLMPHSHTHSTHWTVSATIGGKTMQIMETFNALHAIPEPSPMYYDSAAKNPAPNETQRTPGGYTGLLSMRPGDTISWTCDITNDDVPGGITYANAVYTGEMCNLFGFYTPDDGSQWAAYNK